MSFDINILVNGNRCKQYHYLGKVFIEAKDGSEYSIEIKNNSWTRILAVCSVDGLDIISGKKAEERNAGYVINGYASAKFDGFRVSDDKIAKFVFGSKGDSYASDKGNGAERNVGVVGIRLWDEKITPPPTPIIRDVHHHHHHNHPYPVYGASTPTIWCDATYSTSLNSNDNYCNDFIEFERARSIPTKGGAGDTLGGGSKGSQVYSSNISTKNTRSKGVTGQSMVKSLTAIPSEPLRGFDMGTKWGDSKESKTVEVQFTRNSVVMSTNIYYASRESLIQMGVPIGNEKQVAFPEPFADNKYANPPRNWRG